MKRRAFGTKALMSLCVPIIGACSSGQQGVDGKLDSPSTSAASVINASQNVLTFVPVGGLTNKPLGLGAGHSVSASFQVAKFGPVAAFAVFIGNYANTSDGELQVKLCQAERCSEGTSPLSKSKDNSYLVIPLESELSVREDAGGVNFVLSRLGGSKPLVIWGYPPIKPTQAMKSDSGTTSGMAAKVGLLYSH